MDPDGYVTLSTSERFAYLERGGARDPLVLMLHGFPDYPPHMVPLMEELAARGYRCVAPWMRGYAPSALTGPYHMEQLGDDAAAIATALSQKPCVLVGHDWGAVATYAALQRHAQQFTYAITMSVPHPTTLITALLRQPAQLRRSAYMFLLQSPMLGPRIAARNDLAYVRKLWRRWSPSYAMSETAWSDLASCLRASMPAPIRYYRGLTWPPWQARAHSRRAAAAMIATPTLHIHGSDDGCIAPSACAGDDRFFSGPRPITVLEGIGHFVQLEAPKSVADAMATWLDA